jgi:SAM-dependent methyltransferase
MPPTQYAGGEFDLILSFSVLTHLGRDTQESWLREMHRVLKSGGWFLTTTHGEFTYKFARENLEPEWPEDEFYDCPDSTLAGISPPGYYRGSYQSERYTRREFGKLFEIVEYVPRGACGFQDLVLLRKP